MNKDNINKIEKLHLNLNRNIEKEESNNSKKSIDVHEILSIIALFFTILSLTSMIIIIIILTI